MGYATVEMLLRFSICLVSPGPPPSRHSPTPAGQPSARASGSAHWIRVVVERACDALLRSDRRRIEQVAPARRRLDSAAGKISGQSLWFDTSDSPRRRSTLTSGRHRVRMPRAGRRRRGGRSRVLARSPSERSSERHRKGSTPSTAAGRRRLQSDS